MPFVVGIYETQINKMDEELGASVRGLFPKLIP